MESSSMKLNKLDSKLQEIITEISVAVRDINNNLTYIELQQGYLQKIVNDLEIAKKVIEDVNTAR